MLRTRGSLRGQSAVRRAGRELLLGRFHRSVVSWKRGCSPAPPFSGRDALILITDGVWFFFRGERYTVIITLLRSVSTPRARLRGLYLLRGEECEEGWREAWAHSLTAQEYDAICALVADGGHGLTRIARQERWVYQRCHFHLLKDLRLIAGKRSGRTRHIRERALALVRAALEEPDERTSARYRRAIHRLLVNPRCPRTIRKKVGGFLRHYAKFRACYRFPELRLPATSNAGECVASIIRACLGPMRGLKSPRALAYWLDIIMRLYHEVKCEPKKPTKL